MKSDPESIGTALGRIPSGCSILTVQDDDVSTGVLVSWVQQAGFDPPSISVCIKMGRPVADLVRISKKFLINVIGENATTMFKHFGRGFSLDEVAFAGLDVQPTDYGPMLLDCISYLGCTLTGDLTTGDHHLFVGEVVKAMSRPDGKPYVHVRKTGLTY